VLDFQLKEHERFLLKFNQNFKRFDLDQDGVLNERDFRSLVLSMGVLKDDVEVEQLLHQIDPFNNQKMTYSEIVALLSSHMVPRDEGSG
jgi:Ca2+-binding EF-hand superfamily protein